LPSRGNESVLNMSNNLLYTNNTSLNNTKREICKEHGEEVSYFCFECLGRCFCPECAIVGAHKSHNVMNVKRAYPIVLEKVYTHN
jgi:hypothetical protein